jgi:hypothetical protein
MKDGVNPGRVYIEVEKVEVVYMSYTIHPHTICTAFDKNILRFLDLLPVTKVAQSFVNTATRSHC